MINSHMSINNIKQGLCVIIISLILFSLLTPVHADEDDLDQYQKFWNGGIGVGSPDILAQSFKPTDTLLTRIEINMYRAQETEYNITLSIRKNLSGADLTEKTLLSSEIPTSGQWIEFDFPDLIVEINQTYYMLLIPEGPGMSYVWRGFDNTNFDNYDRGEAWLYANGEWNTENFFMNDWAFKTYKAHYSYPPDQPSVPIGPTDGLSWTSLYYQTVSIDMDGDDISYGWDWNGDEIIDEWTPFYPSGEPVNISHCFLHAGLFFIQVKAKDTYGVESPFSNILAVNISNDPPLTPTCPKGPEIVTTSEEAVFITNTTDPESHYIKYGWDWNGDDSIDEWTQFHASENTINTSHLWSFAGTYNVKVKAMDEYGAQSAFSETTRIVVVNVENDPPEKPRRPDGKLIGWRGLSYSYGSTSIDPNNDLIWYLWDWDDGTTSDWIGPFESGQNCNVSHTWESRGEFQVKVKAKDESGEMSVWSDSLAISMPISIPKLFYQLLSFINDLFSQEFFD